MLSVVETLARVGFVAAWLHMGWVDWTQKKIRHDYLRLWLFLAAAAYAVLGLQSFMGQAGRAQTFLVSGYYRDLSAYVGLSAAAAFLLWRLRVWPAGDVKLFCLLSLYLPLMRLPGSLSSGTKFLEVLINIFVPAAGFLFLTALLYLWRTRFSHQAEFLRELGARRLGPFLRARLEEALALLKGGTGAVDAVLKNPRGTALAASEWLVSVAAMALASYYLSDLLPSTFLQTVVCFALFFLWSRLGMWLGKRLSLGLLAAGFAVFVFVGPPGRWGALGDAFTHISLFSLFLFLGIQVAFRGASGRAGFFLMPVLFMLPGLLPWDRWSAALSIPRLGAWPAAPAAVHAAAGGAFVWAAMGLFFGLSLVFVRIWDAESYQSVPPEAIKPFMNIGPATLERLKADPETFEEHFDDLYADGLTPEQAEQLRRWCRRRGVPVVALAPTISFANWIFFGYLLTLLLNGHVLMYVY